MQAFNALRLHLGVLLPVGQQAFQVAPGAEHAVGTGDDHAADVGTAFGNTQGLDTRGIHRRVDGVASLRVAKGEDQGLALAGALEFCGHGRPRVGTSGGGMLGGPCHHALTASRTGGRALYGMAAQRHSSTCVRLSPMAPRRRSQGLGR